MTTLPYTNVNGQKASLLTSFLFIEAGGPGAGSVWLYNPGSHGKYQMQHASEEEVALAIANVPGFKTALTACQKITDDAD